MTQRETGTRGRATGRTFTRALRLAGLVALTSAMECPRPPTDAPLVDRLVWSVPVPDASEGQPVIAEGRVVVATDSGLFAYALADGRVAWHNPQTNVRASRQLLLHGGRIFAAGVGVARAFDASTGATLWARDLGDTASPDFAQAAVDEDAYYVGTRDRRVVALSPADGHVVWSAPLDAEGWPFGGLVGGVTLAGDTVYATAERPLAANTDAEAMVLVALDRRTGRELWRFEPAGLSSGIIDAPTVVGRLLLLPGTYGVVVGVDRFTERETWRQTRYFLPSAPFVLHDGIVYAAGPSARAYALDPATGLARWDVPMSAGANFAAVCDDELVVNEYNVEMLDLATGRSNGVAFAALSYEFATTGVVTSAGRAYVAGNRMLYAFRCGSGRGH